MSDLPNLQEMGFIRHLEGLEHEEFLEALDSHPFTNSLLENTYLNSHHNQCVIMTVFWWFYSDEIIEKCVDFVDTIKRKARDYDATDFIGGA